MKHTKHDHPAYLKDMNADGNDPDHVRTPALHTGYLLSDGPPPVDEYLKKLIKQFKKGKICAREAIVAMYWIRPYSDFKPSITKKFRHYIRLLGHYGDNFYKGPIPIVLYERDGQLIMSTDYKPYWVHRSNETRTVNCIILGDFTEHNFCRTIGSPFTVFSLDLSKPDTLMDSKTRRLATLLRGEPMRMESKEEMEAINKADFEKALTEPVEYEPDYAKDMNKHGEDEHLVHTPALHSGHFFGPPPEDERYTELAAQTQAGQLDCQLATITMHMIRPYSDYRAVISDELRKKFNKVYRDSYEMTVTVYEYEPGHFLIGGSDENYAIYALYQEKQVPFAPCIIIGAYTKTWAVYAIDKPFRKVLTPQAGFDPKQTENTIGKRIYDLMVEKGLYVEQLAHLTDISFTVLNKIVERYKQPKLPTIEQLERICRVLGVSASDILPF
jgi:DNA-binding Xre family transcriptional regulator